MATQQLLLSLLEGPSRALVSTALAGGVAAHLALSSPRSLCYVERIPYDNDAFLVRRLGAPAALLVTVCAAAAQPLPTAGLPPLLSLHHRAGSPAPGPQSMYGDARQRALASSKASRPIGWTAVARLSTPGHIAMTFGRK